jgi:hypothetical protein
MKVAGIKRKYVKRIRAILNAIKASLVEAGLEVEGPYDMTADDYCWSLIATYGPGENDKADVSFRIFESQEYDGSDEGINFGIDVVEFGGRILGGLTPYNYTPDVWVDLNDTEGIEERFRIIEQADPDDVVPLLERAEVAA